MNPTKPIDITDLSDDALCDLLDEASGSELVDITDMSDEELDALLLAAAKRPVKEGEKIQPGDTIFDGHERHKVVKIEPVYNRRSGRREPHVIGPGVFWPVSRVTVIAGEFWTC